MKELSLHILDIAQNSITAGANLVDITIVEDISADTLSITIKDNGKGMSEEFLQSVRDPFTTTRTTRKVGMGISLFESAATATGGNLTIDSTLGVGTAITANFTHSHIDRQPLGDMAETMVILLSGSPDIDFLYTHTINGKTFVFDTREAREILGGVPLDTIDVLQWVKEYVSENLAEL